ncbi:helix-turn-helix domain-containing protein [Erwinia amylovora]|nr:LysR family transcriptional regulator [Erwinia amylovora]
MDLNLVRVFVAIYETRSVSGAAARLFITQPSASYALARLRAETGNELFKRSRKGCWQHRPPASCMTYSRNHLAGLKRRWRIRVTFPRTDPFTHFVLPFPTSANFCCCPGWSGTCATWPLTCSWK